MLWIDTYHVLGERLGEADVVALLDKVTEGKGILGRITARKALIGHVEEGIVTLALDGLADLAPLRLGRIDTRGVMRTSME